MTEADAMDAMNAVRVRVCIGMPMQFAHATCIALDFRPSNFCGGGGSWLPSMVVVALGKPGVPVICCALAITIGNTSSAQLRSHAG